MTRKQTVNGKVIVRKSTYVRYFAEKRVHLEYRPLAAPKHEYTAWFIGEDGEERGYDVTRKVYDTLNVPEAVGDSAGVRQEWERLRKRQQSSGYRGFVTPW